MTKDRGKGQVKTAGPAPIIVSVENLRTEFRIPEGIVPAVNDVNFHIHSKETVCLVGESGCGKSVTAMSIMRLIPDPPGKIVDGKVKFHDRDLLKLSVNEMRAIRGNEIAMIFQEPMTSLNPLYTVGNQISEAFIEHKGLTRREAWAASVEMLGKVGIPSPQERAGQYIHEMSGGMRQRSMIAMALACNPTLLIADEPTTALDVTIQAQILELMRDLQATTGAAILMITHNLGVVAEMADRVIVMYLGRVVEDTAVDTIFDKPLHPYTKGLMASIPFPGRKLLLGKRPLEEIKGMVPSMYSLPQGCHFHPRCDLSREKCRRQAPDLFEAAENHRVACWLAVE